jgi:hypothetical protein
MVLSGCIFKPFPSASSDMVELTEIQKQTAGRRVRIQPTAKILTSFLATRWPNFCTPNYQQMFCTRESLKMPYFMV